MTTLGTYPLAAPDSRGHGAGASTFRRLARRLAAALKLVQYGRQVQALSQLPDHLLADIGLRRSEIPAYARRLIYESG